MAGHADNISVLLYCKHNAARGKSSGLNFGHGRISGRQQRSHEDETEDSAQLKRCKVNLRLDQAKTTRFPFKKKALMLNNLNLAAADIPVRDLCTGGLEDSLRTLSLAENPLRHIPAELVNTLPVLKCLDLSQCRLQHLPDQWNLPKLMRLNLSRNRLTEFPVQAILKGLPELRELNMYGNKVTEIVIPHNVELLPKLRYLDLGYNELVYLPDNLDQLKSLRVLKVRHNILSRVPQRVCDMRCLKTIDVSSNPVRQPPIETCARGIALMRRYWYCIAKEAETKQEAQADVEQSLQLQTERSRGRIVGALLRHKTTPQNQPSKVNSKDQDEQKRSNDFAVKTDHGFDSNKPVASPKDPPVSSWTQRSNDSVKVEPSFKDQVQSVEGPYHQMAVAAARSDSSAALAAATGANEKVLGLPTFKDQIRDRP